MGTEMSSARLGLRANEPEKPSRWTPYAFPFNLCLILGSEQGNEILYPSGRSSGHTVVFCRPRPRRGHSEIAAHGERGREWTLCGCRMRAVITSLPIANSFRLLQDLAKLWWKDGHLRDRGVHLLVRVSGTRAAVSVAGVPEKIVVLEW